MKKDGITCGDTSLNDGREKFDASYVMIGIVAIVVIVITVALYLGVGYLNLGQYWPPLHWLKYIIPLCFLAFCWFFFHSGGIGAEED